MKHFRFLCKNKNFSKIMHDFNYLYFLKIKKVVFIICSPYFNFIDSQLLIEKVIFECDFDNSNDLESNCNDSFFTYDSTGQTGFHKINLIINLKLIDFG